MQGELTAQGEIVIYPDRRKLLLILLAACAFVVLGVFLVRIEGVGLVQRLELAVAGGASILFFGAVAIYAAYRLVMRRPVVTIGSGGITDNTSPFGVGRLPWSNVAFVAPYRFRGQAMLGVVPRDLDAVLGHLSWWQRLAVKANLRLGCAPVNVPQVTLPGTAEDLAKLIASRFDVRVRLDA